MPSCLVSYRGSGLTYSLGVNETQSPSSFPSYYFKVGDTSSAYIKCSINFNFYSALQSDFIFNVK